MSRGQHVLIDLCATMQHSGTGHGNSHLLTCSAQSYTLGTIKGGYPGNMIADTTAFTGTVRTLDPEARASMPGRIERILNGAVLCAKLELTYNNGCPSVINDVGMAVLAEAALEFLKK